MAQSQSEWVRGKAETLRTSRLDFVFHVEQSSLSLSLFSIANCGGYHTLHGKNSATPPQPRDTPAPPTRQLLVIGVFFP
jgi:hypothetical protein